MRSHRSSIVVAIVALALTGIRDLAAAASLVPILAPVSTIARGALQPVLQFDSKSPDPYAAVSATGLDQQALARFKQTKHGFAECSELLAIYTLNEPDQVAATGAAGAGGPAVRPHGATAAPARTLIVRATTKSRIAVLGAYQIERDSIRFTPRFPWTPGLTYRAVLNLAVLEGKDGSAGNSKSPAPVQFLEIDFTPLSRRSDSTATVTDIYPSSNRLPANLLRMYIHFSAAMSAGHAYEHIRLLDEEKGEVSQPFLALDQEMWDRDHRRLTLLFDPGRIKRGLRSQADLGPPLIPGRRYHLVVDAKMPDGNGNALASSYDKPFEAIEPTRDSLDYKKWILVEPVAGSIEPLRLIMNQPMDHALLERMIAIYHSEPQRPRANHLGVALAENDQSSSSLGTRVEGRIEIASGETEWRFIPKYPWNAGEFKVVIDPSLEDPAGNNLKGVFDADLSESDVKRDFNPDAGTAGDGKQPASIPVVVPFSVTLASRQAQPK